MVSNTAVWELLYFGKLLPTLNMARFQDSISMQHVKKGKKSSRHKRLLGFKNNDYTSHVKNVRNPILF